METGGSFSKIGAATVAVATLDKIAELGTKKRDKLEERAREAREAAQARIDRYDEIARNSSPQSSETTPKSHVLSQKKEAGLDEQCEQNAHHIRFPDPKERSQHWSNFKQKVDEASCEAQNANVLSLGVRKMLAIVGIKVDPHPTAKLIQDLSEKRQQLLREENPFRNQENTPIASVLEWCF